MANHDYRSGGSAYASQVIPGLNTAFNLHANYDQWGVSVMLCLRLPHDTLHLSPPRCALVLFVAPASSFNYLFQDETLLTMSPIVQRRRDVRLYLHLPSYFTDSHPRWWATAAYYGYRAYGDQGLLDHAIKTWEHVST